MDRELPIYQIDAFSSRLFGGNPAAVCPLAAWLPDQVMQAIAAENNLSETAFFVPRGPDYELRWFTPVVEVPLCGHATLAAAFTLFFELGHAGDRVVFHSPHSGVLPVERRGDLLVLDFPAHASTPGADDARQALAAALGAEPSELWVGANQYHMALFAREADVRAVTPDMSALARLGKQVIVTAPGDASDFVSRFFAPTMGIPEDPVTGSAHSVLLPFWAGRLDKRELHALQISARGGEIMGAVRGDRVEIGGRCVCYLRGQIRV